MKKNPARRNGPIVVLMDETHGAPMFVAVGTRVIDAGGKVLDFGRAQSRERDVAAPVFGQIVELIKRQSYGTMPEQKPFYPDPRAVGPFVLSAKKRTKPHATARLVSLPSITPPPAMETEVSISVMPPKFRAWMNMHETEPDVFE